MKSIAQVWIFFFTCLLVLVIPCSGNAQSGTEALLGDPPRAPAQKQEFATAQVRPQAAASSQAWLDVSNREIVREAYVNVMAAITNVPMGWTGDISTGDPGGTSDAYRSAILTYLNWFRSMAGVPALIGWDASLYSEQQQAALMMSVNNKLSHSPDPTWKFYTEAGARAAGFSNLCLGCDTASDPGGIKGYMDDPGAANFPVGHRRWLLYPQTQRSAPGDVPSIAGYRSANALRAFDANIRNPRPPTRDAFVAWPPNGFIPWQVSPARWSFSVANADFSNSTVAVTNDIACGGSQPVVVEPLNQGFGENTIAFVPDPRLAAECFAILQKLGNSDTSSTVTIRNVFVGATPHDYTYTVTVFDPFTGPPLSNTGGIVNGASFAAGAPVAPGSILSIFGSALATSTAAASATPLPTGLLTTSATINGVPIPLYFVSPGQINAQVPFDTAPGTATLAVNVNGALSPAVTFSVAAAAPGIFVDFVNHAVAQNPGGSRNTSGRPAKPGDVILLFMTGQGAVSNPVPTGSPALGSPLSLALATTTATIGGTNADVLFSGLAPGFVGLLQVNIRIPNVAAGDQPLMVTIGGVASNSALITVASQ